MSGITRYHLLDTIRGIAILNMILYHAIWDIANIFLSNCKWFFNPFFFIWQQTICMSFIFISGFCFLLSKKQIKNSILLLVCSSFITFVTALFMKDSIIIFGILTLLGSSYIISTLLKKPILKINSLIGFLASIFLFCALYRINDGYIFTFRLPEALYRGYFLTYLGFTDKSFFSADYFPILPWIFLFFAGIFAYRIFQKGNWLHILKKGKSSFFEFLGRHSLIIYLLHQPVVYGILYLIFRGN